MRIKRGQYGKRIEYYSHPKLGGHVPIHMDKDGKFYAIMGVQDVLRADSLSKIRELAHDHIAAEDGMTWLPVIQASFGRGSDFWGRETEGQEDYRFELTIVRYWIAKKMDGSWLRSHWCPDSELEHRLSQSRRFEIFADEAIYSAKDRRQVTDEHFTLPYSETRNNRRRTEPPTHYLPYSESLWATLNEIGMRVEILADRIIEAIGKPDLLLTMASSLPALPAASGEQA